MLLLSVPLSGARIPLEMQEVGVIEFLSIDVLKSFPQIFSVAANKVLSSLTLHIF